ncbi:hypothetical protein HPB49_019845 [Dermacentor silvarum]|uniref:Uncharacterized protein n=1 Tax=Dermacentor silvarum TaxID=543639 RepID=A0ACB8CB88_DERSI|nr:hypothetical protein HPB49_019845 [Dermacentor silvarum]
MIATSKIRRPPPLMDSERRRLRRVSFVESSTEDATECTGWITSEPAVRQAEEEPRPALRPQDARYDFRCGRDNVEREPNIAPAATSASHLCQGSQPPHARVVPEGPAMPTNSHGPSLGKARVDIFDAVPKAYELQNGERDERDSPEQSWLQSFGIGVLVATLVAAVITLALTADRPEAVYRKEASAFPREVEQITAPIGNRIAASIEAKEAAARIRTKVATRLRDVTTESTSSPEKTETRPPPVHRQGIENQTRPADRRCGRRFYTYCEHGRREAYYSGPSRSCAWSERDRVHVCNRGANRFPNLGTCLDSCARDPPRDRCFESVLFTECSRRDVVEEWWFFDGARCILWNFPLGDCPSSRGGRAFRSRVQCSRMCLGSRRGLEGASALQRSRCRAPVAVTCDMRHIRFPYFADMNAHGSARCVRASKPALMSRLCLVGSNRFDSLSTCSQVCGSSPQYTFRESLASIFSERQR